MFVSLFLVTHQPYRKSLDRSRTSSWASHGAHFARAPAGTGWWCVHSALPCAAVSLLPCSFFSYRRRGLTNCQPHYYAARALRAISPLRPLNPPAPPHQSFILRFPPLSAPLVSVVCVPGPCCCCAHCSVSVPRRRLLLLISQHLHRIRHPSLSQQQQQPDWSKTG